MTRTLIDTDILSYYFKGNPTVVKRFEEYLQFHELIEISIITYYEIVSGLLAKGATQQLKVFDEFITNCSILPMTEKSARVSSELYSEFRRKGKTIDDIDLLIAGIAIENKMTLTTNNERHFGRIPNLEIDNWYR